MANSRAILAGLKAAQSRQSQPALSGPSPLVAQYQQWAAGTAYGAALPRPAQDFLTGAFGPLTPIQPMPIDAPADGERPEPRRWEYPVGWNMPIGVPGTEGLKLTSFLTLRQYADLYSLARRCIELRKDEVCGLDWEIQMTPAAAKAARGDKKAHQDFAERQAKAVAFFSKPDPNYTDFSSWLRALLEDVFVVDAAAIYLHPSRGKGAGLLGSNLAALDLIDGTTIRPLVDLRGSTPQPPSVAFQQYLWGVPRSDLMAIAANEDIEDMGEALVEQYRTDQLLYLPHIGRTWTPYGYSLVESSILPLVTGLMRQKFAFDYFQEGSIPGMFVSPGDTSLTANQLRELQDALNALAGDPAWKHKIVVLPGGSKADPMKPINLADAYDEVVMAQVTMAFDVELHELGVMMGRASSAGAQPAKKTDARPSLKPLLKWLSNNIFNRVLQNICGHADMRWVWEGEESDPTSEQVGVLKDQITIGMMSIDEARQKVGLPPWGLPMTSDPGILTATGFVPLGSIDPETGRPAETHPAEGTQAPAIGQSPAQGNAPAGPGNPAAPASPLPPSSGTDSSSRGGTPLHDGSQPAVTPPGKVPAKAAASELDALRRHLHKGRDITSWQTRYLPTSTVAAISEHLAKGAGVDAAIDLVKAWNPAGHPRASAGNPNGGQFIAADSSSSSSPSPTGNAAQRLAWVNQQLANAGSGGSGGGSGSGGSPGGSSSGSSGRSSSSHTSTSHAGHTSSSSSAADAKTRAERVQAVREANGMLDGLSPGAKYAQRQYIAAAGKHMQAAAKALRAGKDGEAYHRLLKAYREVVLLAEARGGDKDGHLADRIASKLETQINALAPPKPEKPTKDEKKKATKAAGDEGPKVDKVGPKGYEHGWVFVGAPGVGQSVTHPHLGTGTVTGHDEQHVGVRFGSGEERSYELAAQPSGGVFESKPEVSGEQLRSMAPASQWSAEKRDQILTSLRGTEQGKVLADTLDRFQDGGSIARLRRSVDDRLAGRDLNATSAARADAIIGALRTAPTDWSPDVLYRGMSVQGTPANLLAKYQAGVTLDLNLTSFSSDRSVASKFAAMTQKAGTTRVMVEFVGGGKRTLPIQNLARDRRLFKEKEWVSGGRYEVVDAKKSPAGGLLLRIRQVGTL